MDKVVENQRVDNLIYEIRGTEVMLDSDLARLYECVNGTKTINQAVKRHINKFPERYMFQLTKEEYLSLKSQMGTSKVSSVGGVRKLPYVFTEQGVAMLATILHTKVADVISMKIYDAYSILLDIFNEAKDEIIVIDNYVNKELLDILRYVDKKIIIMSKNYNEELIKKYKSQYKNIMLINDNSFHDRYIILDRKEVYTSGMSLKDIGKKYSYINKINESIFIVELLKRVSNVL